MCLNHVHQQTYIYGTKVLWLLAAVYSDWTSARANYFITEAL